MSNDTILVVDKTGQRGFVDPSQLTKGEEAHVRVQFADQQILVSAAMLIAQADGTFYLPLALPELIKQRAREVNQADDSVVLPVIAEELEVQKRQVEHGIRVRKLVHEKQEYYELPLVSEEIEVKRVPINRKVDQPVAIRQEGEVVIIPVLEEVVVIQKQLMLKEEVHIITKRTERRHTGQESLRQEEVLVEPTNGKASEEQIFSPK